MAAAPAILVQQKQQLRIIWTAMFGAVMLYGAVSLLAIDTAAGDGATEWLHNAFTVAGIVLGGLSVWWRRQFLSTEPAPTGANTSLNITQLKGHSVIVWALSEAVAVCGLVLAFIVHDSHEFVPFGAASAALMVLHHPFRLPFDRVQTQTL